MDDTSTTITELKQQVDDFIRERDWHQFHTLKNISMGITIEAAELMELFLYQNDMAPEKQQAAAHELIDILWWTLSFANKANIDIAAAFEEKIKLNAAKYPIEKAKGKATKYTELK